jgi:hypothetical protein
VSARAHVQSDSTRDLDARALTQPAAREEAVGQVRGVRSHAEAVGTEVHGLCAISSPLLHAIIVEHRSHHRQRHTARTVLSCVATDAVTAVMSAMPTDAPTVRKNVTPVARPSRRARNAPNTLRTRRDDSHLAHLDLVLRHRGENLHEHTDAGAHDDLQRNQQTLQCDGVGA